MSSELEIHDNSAQSRFETYVDGLLAEAVYKLEGDTIRFTHTVVPEALGGRGIAGALAKTALASARARGLKVVPKCSFFAGYIQKHPEYQDLLV